MILSYRGIKHALGEVDVTFQKVPDFNDAKDIVGHNHIWSLRGLLTTQNSTGTSSLNAIKAKMAALESQYGTDGGDLALHYPDGTTDSFHVLRNSDTRDGIRVTQGPSWPDGKGVELLTKRTYTIVLEGYVPVAIGSLDTLARSFSETLQFSSAGRKYRHKETLRGRARKYESRRHQVYRVTQKGSAVGLYDYPPYPAPIWPFAVTDELPEVYLGDPKTVGNVQIDWPISWTWTFEHAFDLSGRPHRWKANYLY